MLRDIYVIKDQKILFHMQFGSSINWETLSPIVQSLSSYFEKTTSKDKIDVMNVGEYHITYSTDIKNRMFFVFLSDLTDALDDLEKQLVKAREEFMDMFEDMVNVSTDEATYNSFKPIAEMIHQNLRPKIALVGFSGVGKTTISKLIRAEEIPMDHVPTMTGDIVTIKIGKLYFHLWDFAGQEQFSFLWPQFIQDSDAVLIVNDSTIQNIDKSKFFIDLVKREVPNTRLTAIANKQDLPDAMEPKTIEKLLNVKAYGMIAVDPENRAKMIRIIGDVLDLSPQISPLIRPLLDRDKAVEKAESLLMKGDFQGAIQEFRSIASYCRELGDDKVSLEFLERAQLIESKLQAQQTMAQEADGALEISADSKPTPLEPPVSEVKQEEKIPVTQESDEVPEIPADSKPIPPKLPAEVVREKEKIYITDSQPPPQLIKIEAHYNFIDRNIQSMLTKNYLQFNVQNYDKIQVSSIISNFSISSPLDFLQNVKNEINYSEIPLFPNFTVLQMNSSAPSNQPNIETTEPLDSSPTGSTETPVIAPRKSLEEVLDDDTMPIKEKIQYLKEDLSLLENEMTVLKSDLESGAITQKDYSKAFNKLREIKKNYQEKISDLSIQEIKKFDVSFPDA